MEPISRPSKRMLMLLAKITKNLAHLVQADYRVRIQIRQRLETNYVGNRNEPIAAHIAFQLAFCYQIGFGVNSDDIKCHK